MSKLQIKVFGVKHLENTKKSGFTKKRWFLLIDAAVMLIIALVAIILLRYRPAGYNPESGFENQVSPYLTNKLLPQFYNGMNRKEPFELVIEEKGINEAVTAVGWPQMFNGLVIETPTISFAPQRLELMAMVNYNGVNSVVTVDIKPRFDEKGLLNLEVDKVKMGALSITFVAKKIAKKMFDEQGPLIEPDNIFSLVLASLLADKPFIPEFELEGKTAKVDSIKLENKVLKAHIVPVTVRIPAGGEKQF